MLRQNLKDSSIIIPLLTQIAQLAEAIARLTSYYKII